jgi:hypothetical protein
MKPITPAVNLILKKIFNLHHPYFGEIIINWSKIVGHKYSNASTPLSIRSIKEKGEKLNVLNVEVTNSAMSLELSFLQDVLIERITVYLGFKAIHRLRFVNRTHYTT